MRKKLLFLSLCLILIPQVLAQSGSAEATERTIPIEILLLSDIGLIIGAATAFAYIASLLKQPLIPAYILAGVLIGPIGTSLIFGSPIIYDQDLMSGLSQLGITFLLFTVGMELDLSRLKDVGFASAFIGVGQIAFIFWIGFVAAVFLGFAGVDAVYLGLILTFSSTMVVIKIISDRDEIETLHGRIILGILLIQDVVAIMVLSLMSNGATASLEFVVDALIKGVGLFSFAIVLSKYVSPMLLKLVSKSVELIFLTSLSFAFIFAYAASVLGFSPAIGGFLAGLSLAVFPYNLEVANRIKPLRDFFAIIFFVSLGMQLVIQDMPQLFGIILPIIVLSLIALILKPAIITLLCIILGYERRTSFLAGFGLAQISEFSLILVLPLGIGSPIFLITVIVAIVTISLTSYFISYGNSVYKIFSGFLAKIEDIGPIKKKHELEYMSEEDKVMKNHIVLFGAHVMGEEIIDTLLKLKKRFLVVDNNPEIIKKLIRRGVNCIYGDAEDKETLDKARIDNCKIVISTIPDEDDNHFLIEYTKGINEKAIIFATAKTIDHAIHFYREGADYIMHLKLLGGKKISEHLEEAIKKGHDYVLNRKLEEIKGLEKKRKLEFMEHMDPKLVKQLEELRCDVEVKKELSK